MRATGACLLLAIGFILCAATGALSQHADQQTTALHLSQTAERSVLCDLLRIDLRVEQTGSDPLAIQTDINRRMAAALDRAHRCVLLPARWFARLRRAPACRQVCARLP